MLLPTRDHGLIDYATAAVLIAMPWVMPLDLAAPEGWLPLALGSILLMYSLLTDYEAGLLPRIAMPSHLIFDLFTGVLLAVGPWMCDFADRVWQPHVTVGLFLVLFSFASETVPARLRTGKPSAPVGAG
jgi:hypothetical protein